MREGINIHEVREFCLPQHVYQWYCLCSTENTLIHLLSKDNFLNHRPASSSFGLTQYPVCTDIAHSAHSKLTSPPCSAMCAVLKNWTTQCIWLGHTWETKQTQEASTECLRMSARTKTWGRMLREAAHTRVRTLGRETRAHPRARGVKQELCWKFGGIGKARCQKSGEEEERERGKICGLSSSPWAGLCVTSNSSLAERAEEDRSSLATHCC